MAFRLGLPFTHEQLARHLIAQDPEYLPHLQTLLEPVGVTLAQYYEILDTWDFAVSTEFVKGLQCEACNPQSKLVRSGEHPFLELTEDRNEQRYLAYHVMGEEDEALIHNELLDHYDAGKQAFQALGVDSEKLVWFWANE